MSEAAASAAAVPAASQAPATTLIPAASSSSQQQAAPATSAPAFSWADEGGTFAPNWLEKLPAEMRDNPSLKVVGSLPDLAKSYIETKSMMGKKLEMPGEGATPEQLAAWRKVVGAPEKPEGYLGDAKTLRPESVPEGVWDKEGETAFIALAHKHHLPPAAVKDILEFHGSNIAKSLAGSQATESEILAGEKTKLQTAWGQEYDSNLSVAARVAQTVGIDPSTHPAFASADLVQAFAKLGKMFSEDKLIKGNANGISGSIADRARDITDPKSTSLLAREYRGEHGPERQAAAQTQYHQLLAAQEKK